MKTNQKEELLDLAAFILYGLKEGIPYGSIMVTLAHDVNGSASRALEGDKFFLPRSHGYRKHLKKMNAEVPA